MKSKSAIIASASSPACGPLKNGSPWQRRTRPVTMTWAPPSGVGSWVVWRRRDRGGGRQTRRPVRDLWAGRDALPTQRIRMEPFVQTPCTPRSKRSDSRTSRGIPESGRLEYRVQSRGTGRQWDRTSGTTKTKDGNVFMRYFCLPDTVDTRAGWRGSEVPERASAWRGEVEVAGWDRRTR